MTGKRLEELRFLIVDDDPNMCFILRAMLDRAGMRNYRIELSATAALRNLTASRPDVVICDWKMSPMDGIEFARRMRRGRSGRERRLPVILLTSYAEPERVAEARDAGVNEVLVKPVSAKTLLGRVRSVVERPRQFIDVPSFTGPDRRRGAHPHAGPERRTSRIGDGALPSRPEAAEGGGGAVATATRAVAHARRVDEWSS